MAKDFKGSEGRFLNGKTGEKTGHNEGGTPTTGFDNGSRGKQADRGPGTNLPGNSRRIS